MSHGFTSKSLAGAGNGITDVFINGVKQSTTSGTSFDITSIPSGVKRFTVSFSGVGLSGTESIYIRLGDATSIETTGYESSMWRIGTGVTNETHITSAFTIYTATNLEHFLGTYEFVLHDAATNTWIGTAVGVTDAGGTLGLYGAGKKSLTGELTRIQILSESANTFDVGSINIQYDNPDPTTISTTRSGVTVQTVHSMETGNLSGTTSIPIDTTIPQITEGTEFLSASITPKNVANKLKIEVQLQVAHTLTSRWMNTSLFQDSNADAIAGTNQINQTANRPEMHSFTYWMTAGTTDSTTFSVRCGGDGIGTTYINGNGTTQYYGGTLVSSITITEYSA